jgi:hypothetical protein
MGLGFELASMVALDLVYWLCVYTGVNHLPYRHGLIDLIFFGYLKTIPGLGI